MNNSDKKSFTTIKSMNMEEFINYIILFESVDSILDTCKNQSKKGFIYERLWDVCIKFGFCDNFKKSDFYTDPYPHVIIHDALPQNTYEKIGPTGIIPGSQYIAQKLGDMFRKKPKLIAIR